MGQRRQALDAVSLGDTPWILVPMGAIWLEVEAFLSPDLGGDNNLPRIREALEVLSAKLSSPSGPTDSLSDELI